MVIKTTYNLDRKQFKCNSVVNNKNKSAKTNFVVKNSLSSICNKFGNSKPVDDIISPYLYGANIKMLSQMTARKFVQKKAMDVSLSFSQANKIYKANSDEVRSTKGKIKRSKLSSSTVSNELSKIQQTVSDMNDSDYRSRVDNNRKSKRKRRPSNKYSRPSCNFNNYEFYNGDLMLCPASKTDKKHLNGNKKIDSKKLKAKRNSKSRDHVHPSDVWTMLRNMNRFQYISSPPLSEDSIETIKKKGSFIKYPNNAGLIETTEEFSFISSYDIKNKSQSDFSRKSSVDRVTIIEKKDDLALQELIKRSISNTLSPHLLNKRPKNKRKYQIENKEVQNLSPATDLEICKTENMTKDCLSVDTSIFTKDSASNQCLNKISNSDIDEPFIEITDQLGNDFKSKIKNRYTNKQMFQNNYGNKRSLTEVPGSENQWSGDSDICSKEGLKGLYAIKLTNKNKTMAEKTPEANVNKNNKGYFKHIEIQKKNQSLFSEKLKIIEIRRQLARLKFPIVILTKDEISSTFQVVDYDPPQFNGLNRAIWPFMVKWSQNVKSTKSLKSRIKNLASPKYLPKLEANVLKNNNDANETSKTILNQSGDTVVNIKPAKPKVLGQFKNKIMDLIYNKSQKNLTYPKNTEPGKNLILNKNTNVLKYKRSNTNTKICEKVSQNKIKKPYRESLIEPQKYQSANKSIYPWSKAKWASDFIDNIINKIKKGVYYTQDNNVCEEKNATDTVPIEPENITNKLVPEETDYACIPGFDCSQDFKTMKLEVKMITRTQISIHHCSTNVVLQFDITIPLGTDSVSSSSLSSCSPATTNGHMSTLYRCKTSIPNAIMPGELCSILPKLLNEIMNGNISNLIKPDTASIATSETNQLEQIENANITMQSPKITRLMNGAFCNYKSLKIIGNENGGKMLLNSDLCQMGNGHVSVKYLLGFVNCIYKSVSVQNKFSEKTQMAVPQHFTKVTSHKPLKQCMALVKYIPPKTEPSLGLHTTLFTCNIALTNGDSQNLGFCDFPKRLYQLRTIMDNYYHTNITNMGIGTHPYPIIISLNSKRQNSIEYIQPSNQIEEHPPKAKKCDIKIVKNSVKRSSPKSNKKRKTNSIRLNNCASLNKIINLDDFFSALGWCKTLTNVLQGYSEKNILSSIIEMKNWIKEITQAQALLVLLLSNKKETVNLKRFRPMLLQGIAVNRITTAEELDMELEVIEKENMCISQNEGISFLFGSNDNLLDELCWIAKTTASDYQKPFDESSKKLLRSLLGKRKKLNPSYLRVMARYVGLGLLKQ